MPRSIVISKHGEYPARSFKPIAANAWGNFFDIADADCDLAHWMIEADSGTVRLTARNSEQDEEDPAWSPPAPIVMLVDGIVEAFSSNTFPSSDALRQDFINWVCRGVLDAFESARMARKYANSRVNAECFGIVASPTDRGLSVDALKLLWSQNDCLTVQDVKARQRRARSRGTKKAVKKKSGVIKGNGGN